MPLVGFRPTKARLILEQGNATVLVMRVVTARDERVMLASGGGLQSLTGVLRVREHAEKRGYKAGRATGSLVFIPESGSDGEPTPAKYQINISMSGEKFDLLVRMVSGGRMPAKFFIDVSPRVGPLGGRGFGYISRNGRQVKYWNTAKHSLLPITSFSLILPVDGREVLADPWDETDERPARTVTPASNSQVAELADDLLVFHSETKHMLNTLVISVVAIVLLIAGVNMAFLFR